MKNKVFILVSIIVVIIVSVTLLLANNKSPDALKPIIIKVFTENENRFVDVQRYSMQLDDNLYVYLNNGSVIYDDNQKNNIQISDVKDDIEYILKDLGFNGIYGEDGNMRFIKAGSDNETGIYYIKSGIIPEFNPSTSYYEKIIDNWFFYYENPT